jgi:hypothetical protein
MGLTQDALELLRGAWNLVRFPDLFHLLDYTDWFGYGVGISAQGAQIVLFCRADPCLWP